MKPLEKLERDQRNFSSHEKTRKVTNERIKLGNILTQAGVIDNQTLTSALDIQKLQKIKLGQILIGIGAVTDVKIAGTLAKQLNIPFIRLGNIQIPDTIIAKVPPEIAEKYLAIPIIANHNKLVVAVAGPLGRAAESDLRFITQMPIRAAISPQGDIIEALRRYYPKPTQRT